jgi:hypothetical protein
MNNPSIDKPNINCNILKWNAWTPNAWLILMACSDHWHGLDVCTLHPSRSIWDRQFTELFQATFFNIKILYCTIEFIYRFRMSPLWIGVISQNNIDWLVFMMEAKFFCELRGHVINTLTHFVVSVISLSVTRTLSHIKPASAWNLESTVFPLRFSLT